jgi:hypothetical protein
VERGGDGRIVKKAVHGKVDDAVLIVKALSFGGVVGVIVDCREVSDW